MNALRSRLLSQPWFYATAGAFLVWLVIVAHSQGAGGGAVLSAALNYSVFFAVVGLGQMIVMASGAGNIDLSIPAKHLPSAAYLSTGQDMQGADNGHDPGHPSGSGSGGSHRRRLMRSDLRHCWIPPMVATLASGLVLESFTFVYSRISVAKPAPLLAEFTTDRLLGVPYVTLASIVASLILDRLSEAIRVRALALRLWPERDRRMALRVIHIRQTRVAAYVLCGVFTSLAGVLFAGFVGGPSLNMGSEFLLSSIAVVVIGGTNVAGGQAFGSAPGAPRFSCSYCYRC